jgi:hypothetical protein
MYDDDLASQLDGPVTLHTAPRFAMMKKPTLVVHV